MPSVDNKETKKIGTASNIYETDKKSCSGTLDYGTLDPTTLSDISDLTEHFNYDVTELNVELFDNTIPEH